MSEETPKDQPGAELSATKTESQDVSTSSRSQGFPGKWLVIGLFVIATVLATGTYLLMHSEHGIVIKAPVEIPEASSEAP